MLCNPSISKVNPRTLQPRQSAVFILRLGWTMHDQDVTMIQPYRRGDTTRRATILDLHRTA